MLAKEDLLKILQLTKSMRVLYVEDNKESQTQAIKLFKNYFAEIDTASDGQEGLGLYKNNFIDTNSHYDLVITDIEMPKLNGIDMIKEIYSINNKQKIIVTSAYDDTKYFIDIIELGVESFIQKPLSFNNVTDAFKSFCDSFTSSSLINLNDSLSYNASTKELFDENLLIQLTKNETMFIEYLIDHENITNSLEDIFNHIFYDTPDKTFSPDSIKALVKRLRKKISSDLILHNRTTGYSLNNKL